MPLANILPAACLFATLTATGLATSTASDGDPLAIRRWPDGSVSIENHWGLELRVSPDETQPGETSAANDAATANSSTRRVLFVPNINHALARQPNQNAATWKPVTGQVIGDNSIHVRSIINDGKRSGAIMVRLDGVAIVLLSQSLGEIALVPRPNAAPSVDVVVMPAGPATSLPEHWIERIKLAKPRFVIVAPKASDNDVRRLGEQIGAADKVVQVDHNTFAVSHSSGAQTSEANGVTQLVRLQTAPWKMQGELATLFASMERSCAASQDVFKKLSVKQMNFRPSNGTHTPRWNAEHMMGRQLLFFSQIYHAVDPAIPVMDLNPKQMPPDYVAAHPDWEGAEEARQMKRVSEFTRRYAYALRDVKLPAKAPGSRWTLVGLLRQMERHYDEHTANTIKKFELPDWPAE